MDGRGKRAERLDVNDYDTARLVNKVLTLYYTQEFTQAELAQRLGLSTPKVNRLIKQARQQGMVDITIRTPFQPFFELESRLKAIFGLTDAVVIPAMIEATKAYATTGELMGIVREAMGHPYDPMGVLENPFQ